MDVETTMACCQNMGVTRLFLLCKNITLAYERHGYPVLSPEIRFAVSYTNIFYSAPTSVKTRMITEKEHPLTLRRSIPVSSMVVMTRFKSVACHCGNVVL
jgi:hypothetical protein